MTLSISEVSRRTGLTIHTLRYYDDCGLLPDVQRDTNGYRQFSEDDLEWIGILKCLKTTHMSLDEMQQFTDLVSEGTETFAERLALLQAHRKQVEQRLQDIYDALAVIDDKITYYSDATDSS